MKRKILIFAILIATLGFTVPDGFAAGQPGKNKSWGKSQDRQVHLWGDDQRGRGRHRGWKDAHGYRNYGQYRRTQVGNRRFRMAKRYYMDDGVRRSRWTRIFY